MNHVTKIIVAAASVTVLASFSSTKETGRTIGHTTQDVSKKIGHASRDDRYKDKVLHILRVFVFSLVFVVGYAVASYQASRFQIADEINDFQRELSIATRLLEQYADQCEKNQHSNFAAYVEHATARYAFLVKTAEGFPYFLAQDFISEHDGSVFQFEDQLEIARKKVAACK